MKEIKKKNKIECERNKNKGTFYLSNSKLNGDHVNTKLMEFQCSE